jgi:ribosomal small subunit protein bTHX
MGKGDSKTRRGKLFSGSFGILRPRKKKRVFNVITTTKPEVDKPEKPKAAPKPKAEQVAEVVEPVVEVVQPVAEEKKPAEKKPTEKKPAAKKPAAKKPAAKKEPTKKEPPAEEA